LHEQHAKSGLRKASSQGSDKTGAVSDADMSKHQLCAWQDIIRKQKGDCATLLK
jgi:hypothetical protein